eukprot:403342481
MVSTKCLHKVCKQCVQSKLEKDGVRGLVCYQCQSITQTNMYKEDPDVNLILNQSDDFLPIYCDYHPINTCDILCQQCDILTCKKCAKIHHQGHIQKPDKIVPQILKAYLKNASKLLFQQKLSIDNAIQKLNDAEDNDYDQKCSEFMSLYKEVKKLLSSLVQDKNELWKVDLSKYRLVEKSQPQEREYKSEIVKHLLAAPQRIVQFNQSQSYLNFLKLVNIELDRSYRSLLMTANIENYNQKSFELLFQGSRDGFTAKAFHDKCDNKGPTVSFIHSEFGQTFGGYSSISWQRNIKFEPDENAFIFQLSKQTIHRQFQNKDKAIFNNPTFLCLFGSGCDIAIQNNCNINNTSFCRLGKTYELPFGYKFGSVEANEYLAGKSEFKVVEIEVYALKINQYR